MADTVHQAELRIGQQLGWLADLIGVIFLPQCTRCELDRLLHPAQVMVA
jgi:hypothetical protein